MDQAHGLTTLFLDLNAYFASVEQQLDPTLRGRPVAVVPVQAETACCIAASYEAKAFGVKTGTRMAEARTLCPGIRFVTSRPQTYTRFHERIAAAVETCLPIRAHHSIDEFSCRLSPREQTPGPAIETAQKVKHAIRKHVGECLRCSIGLAPNRFLAKVASDMQKPDGLVVLEPCDLPAKLLPLKLIDLPGIGPRMERRLHRAGIWTVEQLCALTEQELWRIWGSILGRYWWHWLRGGETAETPTRRSSLGHQHVLPPQLRNLPAARGVAVRLLHKAAARLRHAGCCAQRLVVVVHFQERESWTVEGPLHGARDTVTMVECLSELWRGVPEGRPVFVGITLCGLVPVRDSTAPLFEEERHRASLGQAMDRLNGKFGRHAVYVASMHGFEETAPGGIAFGSLPDLVLPDAVGRADEAGEN